MVFADFFKINMGSFTAALTYGAAILKAATGRWV
jgi:hypothetical protein